MIGSLFRFVVVMGIINVNLLHQPQPFQCLHGSVDSRQAQARLLDTGLAIYFNGIKVSLPLPDDFQNQCPLTGNPDASRAQGMVTCFLLSCL